MQGYGLCSKPLGQSFTWAKCWSQPWLSMVCFFVKTRGSCLTLLFIVVVTQVFSVWRWRCFQRSSLLIYLSVSRPVTPHDPPEFLEHSFLPSPCQTLIHFDICYALLFYLCERFFQQSAILWHTFFDWWHLLCYTSIFGIYMIK